MKIRFKETYRVKAENGPEYQAGEVYDLPELSAKHFLRKGRAVIVTGPTVTTPEVMSPEVKEAIKETESRPLGARGGDPVTRGAKAQIAFRKMAPIKGE